MDDLHRLNNLVHQQKEGAFHYSFREPSNTGITFYVAEKAVLTINPTPTGFDVIIPDGVTMTEAAADFVYVLRDQMQHLWKTAGEAQGNG